MIAELSEAYKGGKLMLFAGAGVSANLGLPTWKALIDHIAEELEYDPAVFATYGDALALAEFYTRKKGSIGALRSWMDREWHRSDIDVSTSEVHRLIATGNFHRIYTTNYDRWLEYAHDTFKVAYSKVAKVSDLVSASEAGRQIIKLHGDFEDDESIVLSETSFFERLNFDSPLDIKLRNDVLSNSVLFIGYSLSDINIRLLFYRLSKMWDDSVLPAARPKSYVFTSRPNPVAQEVLSSWGIELVVSDEDNPKDALTAFLQELTGA
jgi:hypothetical protein